MSLAEDQALYAVKPSVQTFLVEHDIELLFALVVFWILALLLLPLVQHLSRSAAGVRDDT
jgi:hypothetical protein